MPQDVRIGGQHFVVRRFTPKGFIWDEGGVEGVEVRVYILESEGKRPAIQMSP